MDVTKYLTGEEALEAKRQGALASLRDGTFFQQRMYFVNTSRLFIQTAEVGDPCWSIDPKKLAALEMRAAEIVAKSGGAQNKPKSDITQ